MRTDTTRKLVHALKVMTLDRRIRAWLEENDPNALEQAEAALASEEAELLQQVKQVYRVLMKGDPCNEAEDRRLREAVDAL